MNICAVNQNDPILVERVNNLNRIYQLEKDGLLELVRILMTCLQD